MDFSRAVLCLISSNIIGRKQKAVSKAGESVAMPKFVTLLFE